MEKHEVCMASEELTKGHKFLMNSIMALDMVDGSLKEDDVYKELMLKLEGCNAALLGLISKK